MSMLYAKAARAKRSISSEVRLLLPKALKMNLSKFRIEGREDWLKRRQQKGPAESLEDMRAKGREDWLKLRQQQTRRNSPDPPDSSDEKDHDAEPDHLPGRLDKGLDDDL